MRRTRASYDPVHSDLLRTLPRVPQDALGRVGRLLAARRSVYLTVGAAVVLPRLAVVLIERGQITQPFTYAEKSDDIARIYLSSGTFGFIPGMPTAYTQPLYSFFLIPLYWTFGRSWEVIGSAQIVVSLVTAILVYEIGRRWLDRWAGLAAALIVAFHPYAIWHDVHVNREILDGLIAAAIFLIAMRLIDRRSVVLAAALGVVFGLAILGNVRLTVLPLVLAALFLYHWRPSRESFVAISVMIVAAVVVVTPWVVRNKVSVGCFAVTTDSRALWEANNPATLGVLRSGGWIDNVPLPKSFPPSAQDAGRAYHRRGKIFSVDECAQVPFYEHKVEHFWEHDPIEKVKLAAQGTLMLWSPKVSPPETGGVTVKWVTGLRETVEPVYMTPVLLLALFGLTRVRRRFAVLALTFLAYQWALAMIFVGATRYRVPWDFVSALLAAAALVDLSERWRRRRGAVQT